MYALASYKTATHLGHKQCSCFNPTHALVVDVRLIARNTVQRIDFISVIDMHWDLVFNHGLLGGTKVA